MGGNPPKMFKEDNLSIFFSMSHSLEMVRVGFSYSRLWNGGFYLLRVGFSDAQLWIDASQ
ncbi:hypothetical protein A8990_15231 [Paenibacillus taihuensis]|uniref:Uncharacterized protein n=1 Tax=Paenibacillus taihuensis TaxID=1156355 RepID=A0A3D9Q998_9BACL|nr:hypothetical protein A8990_15231 [Paenibacillus taihuensis]